MKIKNPAAWLATATYIASKRPFDREDLTVVHGNIAADGFRLHYAQEVTAACECGNLKRHDSLMEIVRENINAPHLIRISTTALMLACQGAIAIHDLPRKNRKRWMSSNALRMIVSNDALYAYAVHDFAIFRITLKNGTRYLFNRKDNVARLEIMRKVPAQGLGIAINPFYLLAALSGMEEDVTLQVKSPKRGKIASSPLVIKSGEHLALIMPMYIGGTLSIKNFLEDGMTWTTS